jgi:hypothetical protein
MAFNRTKSNPKKQFTSALWLRNIPNFLPPQISTASQTFAAKPFAQRRR